MNFNPRPPWGGRLSSLALAVLLPIFQSTPSVGRATTDREDCYTDKEKFQSTPSVGRATDTKAKETRKEDISIHALRGEGDGKHEINLCKNRVFQSTPSVGRATIIIILSRTTMSKFQSTPSVGRATIMLDISARALPFQSTPSVGRATPRTRKYCPSCKFQSTPSVGRATAKIYKYAMLCLYIVHIKLYIFATAVLFT